MNTTSSLQRIKLLLQSDWVEHKKTFLLGMGVLLIIWLLILFWGKAQNPGSQVAMYIIGGFITFIYYCRHIGYKIHRSGSIYYTLPVSNLEKYSTLLIEGLIYFISFLIIFWSGLFLRKLFEPYSSIIHIEEFYDKTHGIGILLFNMSLIFLSYIVFKKHAFLIAIAFIGAYSFILSAITTKFIVNSLDMFQNGNVPDSLTFIVKCINPICIIAILVVIYIGYLKLKGKEIR